MWRSQGVQSERGDIGCEGQRGDNGVIWQAQGATASTDMREWIDHLEQVDLPERYWCTVEVEEGSRDLIIRQEDTDVAWILDSMSGAVRQMDADQMAGQHLRHKQIQQHLSEAAYPLRRDGWWTARSYLRSRIRWQGSSLSQWTALRTWAAHCSRCSDGVMKALFIKARSEV